MVLSWLLGMRFRCHHTGISPSGFGLDAAIDVSWGMYAIHTGSTQMIELSYLKRENEQDFQIPSLAAQPSVSYTLVWLQLSTPKVQWLTGTREKELENARLA